MQHHGPASGGAAARPVCAFAVVSVLAVALAACASSGDSNRAVVTVPNQPVLPAEMFVQQGYCPPVNIRPGTESVIVYERGHEDDPAYVRYQASITQTARECRVVGADTLSIKVGVAGRLTAGPKGGAGTATVPLRVAVVKQNGGNVFYSQAFPVSVAVSPPTYGAEYSQVIEEVTVRVGPDDRDLIVYVGFDEGPPRPTG